MKDDSGLNKSSYRTYEEWKPLAEAYDVMIGNGSYRTYEEWKPTTRDIASITFLVLTVPMRNGNSRGFLPPLEI